MATSRERIWPLVEQMKDAVTAGFYFPALITALAIPDMLGASSSDNGRASSSKYCAWLQTYLLYSDDNAHKVYGFRCSLLHQGSASPHGGWPPFAFIEPSPSHGELHALTTVVAGVPMSWMSVTVHIAQIAYGVDRWLTEVGETATVLRNIERFAHRRPDGLPPHFIGAAVIA